MSLRRLVPFFLLLLVSMTLMTYQSNRGKISPFRFLNEPFHYMYDRIHSAVTTVKEPFRKIKLRDEENTRLKYEMNRLLLEQQKYREIYFENQRLRELLGLREREKRYVATARVSSKGLDHWTQSLIIDKGEREGVLKDMAVITPLGFVRKGIERDRVLCKSAPYNGHELLDGGSGPGDAKRVDFRRDRFGARSP